MAALDALIGNEALKEGLLAALRARRLCQSVLLYGGPGLGAGFAARCLAADFLYPEGGAGARQVLSQRSPECLSLRGEGAGGEIRVEAVRLARREIFNTPLSAAGRAVIVYGADRLNLSSANALLKSLEEPPENVLFILTAPCAANVLPTVRSRCCAYSLSPVSEAQCAAYLAREFPRLSRERAAQLAGLFGGRLGMAKKCLSTPEGRAALESALALCGMIGAGDDYGVMALLSRYEKARGEAIALLRTVRALCGAALTGAAGGQAPLSPSRAAACAEAAGEAVRRLDANVYARLVLTQFAVSACADAR